MIFFFLIVLITCLRVQDFAKAWTFFLWCSSLRQLIAHFYLLINACCWVETEIGCFAIAANRREVKTKDSSACINGEQSIDRLSRALKEIK